MAEETRGGISARSVQEATGRDWTGWFEVLDAAGASSWSHRDIAAWLGREHGAAVSPWWQQSVTVAYEQARGLRAVGQTSRGFQVAVQRTLPAAVERVWDLVGSRPEVWLGTCEQLAPGEGYQRPVPAEGHGEVRAVRPGSLVRVTWEQDGWPRAAVVELGLAAAAAGRCTVRVQVTHLPDAGSREAARAEWRAALDRLADALA